MTLTDPISQPSYLRLVHNRAMRRNPLHQIRSLRILRNHLADHQPAWYLSDANIEAVLIKPPAAAISCQKFQKASSHSAR